MTEMPDDENPVLRPANLPATENPSYEALDPAYITMLRAIWIAAIVIFAIAVSVASLVSGDGLARFASAEMAPFIGLALLILLWCTFKVPRLLWRAQGYQLREKDVHFKKGVLWRSVTSLPYIRIQHVELESDPIERLFKLATLKFFTAGGGSTDLRIPGLTFATASKIRTFILKQAGTEPNGLDNGDKNGSDE